MRLVTFHSTSRRTLRLNVALATLPLVLGLCGFVFGLVMSWIVGVSNISWTALGKVCFAGAVVSVVPLIWALILFRNRGNSGLRVVVE